MPKERDYASTSVSDPAPDESKPPRGVVAVLRQDGRFLLVRRGEAASASGWWCFPGGALEPGESEVEALVREIREELGLAVRPARRLWRAVTAWGVDLAWWQVEAEAPVTAAGLALEPGEIAEAAWFTRDEAVELERLLGSNLAFFQRGIDARLAP